MRPKFTGYTCTQYSLHSLFDLRFFLEMTWMIYEYVLSQYSCTLPVDAKESDEKWGICTCHCHNFCVLCTLSFNKSEKGTSHLSSPALSSNLTSKCTNSFYHFYIFLALCIVQFRFAMCSSIQVFSCTYTLHFVFEYLKIFWCYLSQTSWL